jgi:hypothetical protein
LRGEARKKRRAAARALAAETSTRETSKRKAAIFAGCAMAAVGLSYVAWTMVTNRFWSGDLRHAAVTSEGIFAMVSIDHVAEDGNIIDYRLVLVDPVTGARKARRIFGDEATCEEVELGYLWCRSDDEVRALRLGSLDDQATWGEVQKAVPVLAGGIDQGSLKVAGGALVVTANDGRLWSLHANPLGGVEGTTERPSEPGAPASSASKLDLHTGSLEFGGGNGARSSIVLHPSGAPGAADVPAAACSETYLTPTFLLLRGGPGVAPSATLHDPEGGLVRHESSMKHEDSHTLISRVGPGGCPLWTHDLGKGHIELATSGGGVLTIVGEFPRGDAVAIGFDLASGAQRWRRRL